MKLRLVVILLLTVLLISSCSLAQTTTTTILGVPLLPGTANFSISAIYVPSGGVNVTGNATYLNSYWEAYYSDGSEKNIGVVCFLNCDESFGPCSPPVQNCTVFVPPGKGVCSITTPKYNTPYNTVDFVSCRIYDPANPDLVKGYFNSTFTPIDFSVSFSKFSSVVGEEFSFPIDVKNSGLFSDRYTVNISPTQGDEAIVNIRPDTKYFITDEIHGDSFDPHIWRQLGPELKSFNIKITILDASANAGICVNVTSERMREYGYTMSKPLPSDACIEMTTQFKVMPELSLSSLLFLLLIASAFIFKLKTRF